MPVYPNRERALRHLKRTQAAYLYGRFPQRYILGMPCCDPGFLTKGRDHSSECLANLARLQGAINQMHAEMQQAALTHGYPHYYEGARRVPALPGASAFPWSHAQA